MIDPIPSPYSCEKQKNPAKYKAITEVLAQHHGRAAAIILLQDGDDTNIVYYNIAKKNAVDVLRLTAEALKNEL